MNSLENATFIGMDLGAYKTSVACSNGHRAVVKTAVAQPNDLVSRSMLGNAPVFGDDALKHVNAMEVIRPFAKGLMKYGDANAANVSPETRDACLTAARLIVEHAVSLTNPASESKILGVIGAPSRASLENKQFILEACEGVFESVFVVPEPFTVAYGMNSLSETLVVDIGGGTIDICPMLGRLPTDADQVTIPLGGDLIDEALQAKIVELESTAEVSLAMARQIKERHGFVGREETRVRVTLPTSGRPTEFDVTSAVEEACAGIVEPIMDGIREVFVQLPPEHKQVVLRNVVLAGGGGQLKGLDQAIEQRLVELGGGHVTRAFDSVFAGATGALKLALAMDASDWSHLVQSDRERHAA